MGGKCVVEVGVAGMGCWWLVGASCGVLACDYLADFMWLFISRSVRLVDLPCCLMAVDGIADLVESLDGSEWSGAGS